MKENKYINLIKKIKEIGECVNNQIHCLSCRDREVCIDLISEIQTK